MVQEWSVPVWAVLATLGALLLSVLLLGVLTARSRSSAAALRERVAAVEARLTESAGSAGPAADTSPVVPDVRTSEYVITSVGGEAEAPAPAVPAPLFADLVLRESVVQAASLAAGLRRALSPEVRHRIRFEMRREVKRARKQRRTELKVARRDWEARQRAEDPAEGPVEDSAEGSAA